MCIIGNKVDLREERGPAGCVGTAHGEKLASVGDGESCVSRGDPVTQPSCGL